MAVRISMDGKGMAVEQHLTHGYWKILTMIMSDLPETSH